jgi:hypothetical protein
MFRFLVDSSGIDGFGFGLTSVFVNGLGFCGRCLGKTTHAINLDEIRVGCITSELVSCAIKTEHELFWLGVGSECIHLEYWARFYHERVDWGGFWIWC